MLRTRSPENVVADIRESIRFFHRGHVRLAKDLWLTDDNFFADRDWAMSVLRAIVDSGIRYRFNVQARYEVGFDDEMLDLLRQAGFFELDLGIEFLGRSLPRSHRSKRMKPRHMSRPSKRSWRDFTAFRR